MSKNCNRKITKSSILSPREPVQDIRHDSLSSYVVRFIATLAQEDMLVLQENHDQNLEVARPDRLDMMRLNRREVEGETYAVVQLELLVRRAGFLI